MIKHDSTQSLPELPHARRASLVPTLRRGRRVARLLHQIEFFSAERASDLLDDEDVPNDLRNLAGQPRDPRVRAMIQAAARGWISDRARLGS